MSDLREVRYGKAYADGSGYEVQVSGEHVVTDNVPAIRIDQGGDLIYLTPEQAQWLHTHLGLVLKEIGA